MIGWIGNTNLEPLKKPRAVAPFDQTMNELLNKRSSLYTRPLDAVALFLSAEDFLKDIAHEAPGRAKTAKAVSELRALLTAVGTYLKRRPGVPFLMNNLVLPPYRVTTDIPDDLERRLNDEIHAFRARHTGFLVLDWERLVRLRGYDALVSDKFAYLGRIRLTQAGFDALSDEAERLLRSHRGSGRKVLAVDADNVLWGGEIGEAGADGLLLSEEELGKAYRDLQKAMKALERTGVLLVLLSKNNEADVKRAFKHPMMVLGWKDFAAKRIDWQPKSENLAAVAEELGLGADAFVFIDDSPVERQRMRVSLPKVAVPEFPSDPSQLKRWFLTQVVYPHFARTALTAEDKARSRSYARRAVRSRAAQKLDTASFLRMLKMKLRVHVNDAPRAARAAQLTQRTNQFNLTTRRYDEAAVRRFMRSKDSLVLTLDYEDKFGKEGTVAAAIVKLKGASAVLDDFMLSCRVIGRRVEHAFMKEIEKALKERRVRTLRASFIPTARNAVASGFLAEAGFTRKSKNEHEKKIS